MSDSTSTWERLFPLILTGAVCFATGTGSGLIVAEFTGGTEAELTDELIVGDDQADENATLREELTETRRMLVRANEMIAEPAVVRPVATDDRAARKLADENAVLRSQLSESRRALAEAKEDFRLRLLAGEAVALTNMGGQRHWDRASNEVRVLVCRGYASRFVKAGGEDHAKLTKWLLKGIDNYFEQGESADLTVLQALAGAITILESASGD